MTTEQQLDRSDFRRVCAAYSDAALALEMAEREWDRHAAACNSCRPLRWTWDRERAETAPCKMGLHLIGRSARLADEAVALRDLASELEPRT